MNYYAAVRAFLLASEAGSFSIAAKMLSVKASTVSKYVSCLEEDIGETLFSRSTHGVVLTEHGTVFKKLVQAAIDRLNEAYIAVSIYRDNGRGGSGMR
ncbi:LysR family transcriptional regulator [Burkholderia multivorans]|nr:LysR family transcriptional regulator [Burkholderia multivorans]